MTDHNITSPRLLLVGLGNPGADYASTRHNAGIWWINEICKIHNVILKTEKKFSGYLAKTTLYNVDIYFLTPSTYMNLSGKAVASVAKYYTVHPEAIIIAHDDLDLPVGTIRLKDGGGHQGHNGLRDIVATLGANNFKRLRIGIGRPGDKDEVSDYVLGAPSKDEKQQILAAIDKSVSVLPDLIQGNWQQAVHQLHSATPPKSGEKAT